MVGSYVKLGPDLNGMWFWLLWLLTRDLPLQLRPTPFSDFHNRGV